MLIFSLIRFTIFIGTNFIRTARLKLVKIKGKFKASVGWGVLKQILHSDLHFFFIIYLQMSGLNRVKSIKWPAKSIISSETSVVF